MGARLDLTTVLGFGTRQNGVSLVMGVSSWEDPSLKDAAQFVSSDHEQHVGVRPARHTR